MIDDSILKSYKLWPTNFIAYDILNTTSRFAHLYDDKERQLFERRLEMRIDAENETMKAGFLAMYANPVVNKLKYTNDIA